MKNLFANWKTTSAGLAAVAGALIHLGFAIKAHTADENMVTTTVFAIIAGIGLMAAGDANQSVSRTEADTVFIKKPNGPDGPATNP